MLHSTLVRVGVSGSELSFLFVLNSQFNQYEGKLQSKVNCVYSLTSSPIEPSPRRQRLILSAGSQDAEAKFKLKGSVWGKR